MTNLKFFLRLLFLRFFNSVKNVVALTKLKSKYPTLRVGWGVTIIESEFARHNYVGNETFVSCSKLGDYSYIAENSYLLYTTVGKFTCIGPNVRIGLPKHPAKDFVSVHPAFYSTNTQIGATFSDGNYFEEFGTITIGNDAWVGAGAIVTSGITIGDGAVIAAGSVVTKDVPPYAIVGGVPAKLIRQRHTGEQIGKLLELKWWDKSPEWLKSHFRQMHDVRNIDELLND